MRIRPDLPDPERTLYIKEDEPDEAEAALLSPPDIAAGGMEVTQFARAGILAVEQFVQLHQRLADDGDAGATGWRVENHLQATLDLGAEVKRQVNATIWRGRQNERPWVGIASKRLRPDFGRRL